MPLNKIKVLLVDDLTENLLALEAVLQREDLDLLIAKSATDALELLLVHDFALALIDVQMPEIDGFELAELMRGTERTRTIPIIFLTAGAVDQHRRFRGYEAGAVDFLTKPFDPQILRSKAQIFFDLYNQRRAVEEQRDELIKTQQELINARDLAEKANQSKDRFLAILSHELRTPLGPALMGVQFLSRRKDLPKEVTKTLELIERNIKLEARLIDDLLDLSRIKHGKIQLVRYRLNIHDTLRDAIETCRNSLSENGQELKLSFQANSTVVPADGVRLQQVFWNLIANAAKFTPANGTVEIETHNQDATVVVRVSDNGRGIESHLLPKLFDAFEQGDSNAPSDGLGLGLAICKGIVELHDGTIFAASAGKGSGASFTVILPLASATAAAADEKLPVAGDNANCPKHILIVEDHEDTRLFLRVSLQGLGHQVTEAGSVREAIEAGTRASFDVLLCDIGLPDGDGYQVVQSLPQKPALCVALTGYGMAADVEAAFSCGFDEHLTKPIDLDLLQSKLSRLDSAAANNRAGQKTF